MKILSVVGTRPNLIKVSVLSHEIRKNHEEIIIDTGQHYDKTMSDVFYNELDVPSSDYNLGVGSSSHATQTGDIIRGAESIISKECPDYVLVYGDTNSTLGGAICAAKLGIPVIHVEAGLRSYDRNMPEEINRVIADHLSTICCCPTRTSMENLQEEGVGGGNCVVAITGDVMLDSVNKYINIAVNRTNIIDHMGLYSGHYFVATIHRAENTDDPRMLTKILKTFENIGEQVVFPLHPRTRQRIASYGLSFPDNVFVVDPIGYLDMLILTKFSRKVITDSGGLQKEAYFLGTPCITVRKNTEWVETLHGGWNVCAGNKIEKISELVHLQPNEPRRLDLFGSGDAARSIVSTIEKYDDINEK
jgi:UDP-N-acetylglucosamine 2-epimerase (non-hydrolysing)